jgi:hypothetical protein
LNELWWPRIRRAADDPAEREVRAGFREPANRARVREAGLWSSRNVAATRIVERVAGTR